MVEGPPPITPTAVLPAAPRIEEKTAAPVMVGIPSAALSSEWANVRRPDLQETLEQALQRAIDEMESTRRSMATPPREGVDETARAVSGSAVRGIEPLATA